MLETSGIKSASLYELQAYQYLATPALSAKRAPTLMSSPSAVIA